MDYFWLAIFTIFTFPLYYSSLNGIRKREFHMRIGHSGSYFFYKGKAALLLYAITLPISFIFWLIPLGSIFKEGFDLIRIVGVLVWIAVWFLLVYRFNKWGQPYIDKASFPVQKASSKTLILAIMVSLAFILFALTR